MILTERFIGKELAFYRALKSRSNLNGDDAKNLYAQESGLSGEYEYDRVFDETGHGPVLVFRDIYLKVDGAVAQYDALIVSDEGIVVNEIKNYSGLYRYENGKWFKGDFEVSEDALVQLRRAIGKLVKLRYRTKANFDISGKIVFTNIELRLRSADDALWQNVVLRSGLRDYLSQFKNMYAGRPAENIARLIESHIVPNPYFDKNADFEVLKKGLYCGTCGRFELEERHYHFVCNTCGCKETKESHVLRAIADYKALFLNRKLIRKHFLEFIDFKVSPKTVYRLLNKYCEQQSSGRGTYYIFRYRDFEDACKNSNRLWRYKDYGVNQRKIE